VTTPPAPELSTTNRRNRDMLATTSTASPESDCPLPGGGMFAFPDVSGLLNREHWSDTADLADWLLTHAHVAQHRTRQARGYGNGWDRLSCKAIQLSRQQNRCTTPPRWAALASNRLPSIGPPPAPWWGGPCTAVLSSRCGRPRKSAVVDYSLRLIGRL
jgi:hypothetical protein